MSFPNKETQFKKGKSGNPAGQPKGFISLDTMVRRILEGDEMQPAIDHQGSYGFGPLERDGGENDVEIGVESERRVHSGLPPLPE
ncbi:DUF5681 domain-containing protein [Bradyrhizobium sp. URHD0069]|uniref:DUF5681 domain-containing protein n=1 Tax=Bradyrhizobium sp. URHD0069 TaxID=1380355 RepID=UPI0018CC197D|nr:DUF5681 domain-containing protein [Bradyrhizobium sp. URHD0069]